MEFRMFLFLLSGFFVITVLTEQRNCNGIPKAQIRALRNVPKFTKSQLEALFETAVKSMISANATANFELSNFEKIVPEEVNKICTGHEYELFYAYIKSKANEAKAKINFCNLEYNKQVQFFINKSLQEFDHITVINDSLIVRCLSDQAEETCTIIDNVAELLQEGDAACLKFQENIGMVNFLLNRFRECIEISTNSAIDNGLTILAAIRKKKGKV